MDTGQLSQQQKADKERILQGVDFYSCGVAYTVKQISVDEEEFYEVIAKYSNLPVDYKMMEIVNYFSIITQDMEIIILHKVGPTGK